MAVAAGLVAGVSMLWLFADRPAELLVLREPAVESDAALVLGGDPRFERTEHAVRLYERGLVGRLILSGGEPGPGDSAESLAHYAIARGVTEEDLVLEERATSTRESAVFVAPILERERIHALTIVTSPYHQRRAFLTTSHVLGRRVRLVNSPADPSFFQAAGWWKDRRSARVVLGEYVKLAYYALRGWI